MFRPYKTEADTAREEIDRARQDVIITEKIQEVLPRGVTPDMISVMMAQVRKMIIESAKLIGFKMADDKIYAVKRAPLRSYIMEEFTYVSNFADFTRRFMELREETRVGYAGRMKNALTLTNLSGLTPVQDAVNEKIAILEEQINRELMADPTLEMKTKLKMVENSEFRFRILERLRMAAVQAKARKLPSIKKVAFLANEGVLRMLRNPSSFFQKLSFCMEEFVALLLAFLVMVILGMFLFINWNWFAPQCPAVNGRKCNDVGQCVMGQCVCYNAFSGSTCAETVRHANYNISSNVVCNGRGFLQSVISIPAQCASGWNSAACQSYTTSVLQKIELYEYNLDLVPEAFTIPLCGCFLGNGGFSCDQAFCPLDNNGIVCSGNGNKTVGLAANNTDPSNKGCQCRSLVSFVYPVNYLEGLTFEQFRDIQNNYYYQYYFASMYCGKIYNRTVNGTYSVIVFSPPAERVNTLNFAAGVESQLQSLYKCFCNLPFVGTVCNQGACPMNPVTRAICNDRGSPILGMEIAANSTSDTTPSGRLCDINCLDGWERCTNNQPERKCVYKQTNDNPIFLKDVFCNSPSTCPANMPIRCGDGSCAAVPALGGDGTFPSCDLGYVYGSIDYGQLTLVRYTYMCTVITTSDSFTACFANTSAVTGAVGYVPQGGAVFNMTTLNYTFDLASPLIYFEFSHNYSFAVSVTTWDGQVAAFSAGTNFVSGTFQYQFENQGNWIVETSHLSGKFVYVTVASSQNSIGTSSGLAYNVCPMPFNFTSGLGIPANYSLIRIQNSNENIITVLRPTSFHVSLANYSVSDRSLYAYSPGFLVRLRADAAVSLQQLWYVPFNGQTAANSACLANPAFCAWYNDPVSNQLRNLQSTFFVCNSSTDDAILLNTPCPWNFTDFAPRISFYILSWQTCAVAQPTLPIAITTQRFDVLERNYTDRKTWPFTINFGDFSTENDTAPLTSMQNMVFLTQSRLTFACACPPSVFQPNRSTLNEVWFADNVLRQVSASTTVPGDHVLAATYVTGERELFRTRVRTVNEEEQTLLVEDVQSGFLFNSYFVNARTLGQSEILRGFPDANLLLTPFKCPDGSPTPISSVITDIPVDCNCTYSIPMTYCNCADRFPTNFTCECNSTVSACSCALPATPEFEVSLWNEIEALETSNCSCIIDAGAAEHASNGSATITPAAATTSVSFSFDLEQIPTHIVVKTSGSYCNSSTFNVSGSSFLFTSVDIPFTYTNSPNTTICEHWLTLFVPSAPAFSNITVYSNDTISWATMLFSVSGISLMQLAPAPVFSASSNTADAKNVNYLNASYWSSSTSLYELPNWIKVNFPQQYYVDYVTLVFAQAGVSMGNTSIPLALSLLASNNNGEDWYYVHNISVFVEEGGWKSVSFEMRLNSSFSEFMIYTNGGPFALRQWQMFSDQACSCADGTNLVMQISDFTNLPTIESELAEIAFFNEFISPGNETQKSSCICVNNCTVRVNELLVNMSNDGYCQDIKCQADLLNIPGVLELAANLTTPAFGASAIYTQFNYEVFAGISTVQFSTISSGPFLNTVQLQNAYDGYLYVSFYALPDNVSVYFMDTETLQVIVPYSLVLPNTEIYYVNGTENSTTLAYAITYPGLSGLGTTCEVGFDCADGGPSSRVVVNAAGYTCSLTFAQQSLLANIANTSVVSNRTYYASNFSDLTPGTWSAFYQNIRLTRKITQFELDYCEFQTCPKETPLACPNGRCVQYESECLVRYDCPGNGCIELRDSASDFTLYQCACGLGANGDACQFTACLPATPYNYLGTAPAAECTCGAPPNLKARAGLNFILPQNPLDAMTIPDIININNQCTGFCCPASQQANGFICVVPNHAPFGTFLHYKYVMFAGTSSTLTEAERTIYTGCPIARKGYYGEYILYEDDVLEVNIYTGEVTAWRTYINPTTGQPEQFIWPNAFTLPQNSGTACAGQPYCNAFPFRAPNGQCLENEAQVESSLLRNPLCNGRGTCMADGYCECNAGYKTFTITVTFSTFISVPYTVVDGIPNPVDSTINWNWKHFAASLCVAKNCDILGACEIPRGCPPGDYDVATQTFQGAYVSCTSAGYPGRCAPNLEACRAGVGLTFPLTCSGKGIVRTKDFTNEKYCHCGDPISPNINISDVTQITQLKPNGWGGEFCSEYLALEDQPLVWSPWNFELDEPWRSSITNEILPGKWIKGNIPMGPSPADAADWERCCSQYSRLELCPFTPCQIDAGLPPCLPSAECIPQKNKVKPLVYPCNSNPDISPQNGTARRDGTCQCRVDVANGYGYTYDYSQFSIKGCYKLVKTPPGNCNPIDPCTRPEEWRHPLAYVPFLEQQWYTAGAQAMGVLSNLTLIDLITVTPSFFQSQVVSALVKVALEVLAEIANLAACICVYPTDTEFSKYAMVTTGNFTYKQSFVAPYLLQGTFYDGAVPYPEFSNNNLQALQFSPQNVLFSYADRVYTFLLNDTTNVYNLSAIRIWAETTSTATAFNFTNKFGQVICNPGVYQLTSGSPGLLHWALGQTALQSEVALNCGPVYRCVNFQTEFKLDYEIHCTGNAQSTVCLDWQFEACLSLQQSVYWPLDSVANYYQCDVSTPRTCTCCQIVGTVPASVYDGIINIGVVNPSLDMYIGQVRFYGVTNVALTPPETLIRILQSKLTGPDAEIAATCQDYKFYSSPDYLGPDRNLYTPSDSAEVSTQSLIFREDTENICDASGGVFAVNTVTVSLTPNAQDYQGLVRTCEDLAPNKDPQCWVNARDVELNDQLIGRNELFTTSCTEYGCYQNDPEALQRSPIPLDPYMTFSTYPLAPIDSLMYRVNTSLPVPDPTTYSRQSSYVGLYGNRNGLLGGFPPGVNPGVYSPIDIPSEDIVFGITFRKPIPVFPTDTLVLTISRADIESLSQQSYRQQGIRIQLSYLSAEFPDPGVCDTAAVCPTSSFKLSTATGSLLRGFGWGFTIFELWDAITTVSFGSASYLIKDIPGLSFTKSTLLPKFAVFWTYMFARSNSGVLGIYNLNAFTSCQPTQPFIEFQGPFRNQGQRFADIPGGIFISQPSPNYVSSSIYENPGGGLPFQCFQIYQQNSRTVQYQLTTFKTASGSGIFGQNFIPGTINFPYIPVFFDLRPTLVIGSGIRTDRSPETCSLNWFGCQTVQTWDTSKIYAFRFPNSNPAENLTALGNTLNIFDKIYDATPYIQPCQQCQKTVTGTYMWDQLVYSQTAWLGKFTPPNPERTLFLIQKSRASDPEFYLNVTANQVATAFGQPSQDHLLTYIQSVNNSLNSPTRQLFDKFIWRLDSCLTVSKSGAKTTVCDLEKKNYICQHDFTKYTVVSGYQGPPCGPNTRTGAAPQPGLTCQASFPLANSTQFPLQHLIKNQYLSGTLDLFAESFNIPSFASDLTNVSVIFGLPEAWKLWVSGFSNRPGHVGRDQSTVPDQNWRSFSLVTTWQYGCTSIFGTQRNPRTNVIEEWCASSLGGCNLNSENPLYTPLFGSPPQILQQVSAEDSFTNPTCGPVIYLQSYNQVDKDGGIQPELDIRQQIIEMQFSYIVVETISNDVRPIWFNAGKSGSKYVFMIGLNTTISGSYSIGGCVGDKTCPGAIMRVFIYPLNPFYDYPTVQLERNVSLITDDATHTYQVSFNVTEDESGGFYTVNDQTFPTYVYRGVGFEFFNLNSSTSIYLTNPILTNADTRETCTTRNVSQWYDPPPRIKSTVPRNTGIFTDEDMAQFPGKTLGQCGCALPFGGEGCDCPNVIFPGSSGGDIACGGFGDAGVGALGWDGNVYTTRSTVQDAGCYKLNIQGSTGEIFADCKTINLGRWAFSLLYGTVYAPQAVFIQGNPLRGESLFFQPINQLKTPYDYEGQQTQCLQNQNALVPYFYTPDELTQLMVNAVNTLPVFINIAEESVQFNASAGNWPWETTAGNFFLFGNVGEEIATPAGNFDCTEYADVCSAINFNNWAYSGLAGDTVLNDGNSYTSAAVAGGTITYSPAGPEAILVYVFGNIAITTNRIECSPSQSGYCDDGTVAGTDSYYLCRCPTKQIAYAADTYAEIQIFDNSNFETLTPSYATQFLTSMYPYNL